MDVFHHRLPFFLVLLSEMSYFRSISAFSFQHRNTAERYRLSKISSAIINAEMNSVRGTASNSKFEAWYQKTIESLSLCEPLTPIQLDEKFSSSLGNIGKSNVTFKSKAWESKSLRYIRLISFVGEGYDVFNFLAIPRSGFALPILGIDIVSLPSKFCVNYDIRLYPRMMNKLQEMYALCFVLSPLFHLTITSNDLSLSPRSQK